MKIRRIDVAVCRGGKLYSFINGVYYNAACIIQWKILSNKTVLLFSGYLPINTGKSINHLIHLMTMRCIVEDLTDMLSMSRKQRDYIYSLTNMILFLDARFHYNIISSNKYWRTVSKKIVSF